MAVVDSVAVDDDVGFIRLQDRRVVASGRDRHHDVAARHRRQVAHQSGQVVAGFEQHQATRPVEFLRGVGDGVGELVVRELLRVRQHRHLFAVAAQVVQDPAHVEHDPGANHLDPHLGVDRRRVEAVLAHDDRGGVTGRVDGQQHVVAEELGGDHRSNAVELFTVRNHRRNKLFGPQHERGGSVGGRSLHRYAAERAVGDSRCDSAVEVKCSRRGIRR